jgi:hexosaminidase
VVYLKRQFPFSALMPAVQSVAVSDGIFDFTAGGEWYAPASECCLRLISKLFAQLKCDSWTSTSGRGDASVVFELCADGFKLQSYRIKITPQSVVVSASDDCGLYYGALTLFQLVALQNGAIACCTIYDAPDFEVRGVMLDISRDKVPLMQTLFDLVDSFSRIKINHLQLYMEHTFAYEGHKCVWKDASPLTPAEIRQLDKYCVERFIELVPNQNSFGHMERWLVRPEYNAMAALPEGGALLPWGGIQRQPTALNPMDERCLPFLDGLFSQLLPNFSAKQFNVGCDEVFGLSISRCAQEVEAQGAGRVYLDFLKKVFDLVRKHGYKPAFWGDIIVKYPELVAELPHDAIALEWGYEADHPFADRCRLFSESGLFFYVCPGTSSWNSIAGRYDNMHANILSAAENGLKYGAQGLVITDWGDAGHWQPLSAAYAGFAFAAGVSWSVNANRDMDIGSQVSRGFIGDGGGLGEILVELGHLYKDVGALTPNSSVLFHLLFKDIGYLIPEGVSIQKLNAIMRKLDDFSGRMDALPETGAQEPVMVLYEIQQMIRLLKTACFRGIAMLSGTMDEKAVNSELQEMITSCAEAQEMVWYLRNRRGGLSDSLARIFRASYD